MPINYSEYHAKWPLISRLIRYRRARNRCEWCGVQNGRIIQRDIRGRFSYLSGSEIESISVEMRLTGYKLSTILKQKRLTKIILTVAHLDHDKTNNRFSNLAALCQRCHLSHDLPHHINNRRFGCHWKRNQLSLF